jgi:hypothetical protein
MWRNWLLLQRVAREWWAAFFILLSLPPTISPDFLE